LARLLGKPCVRYTDYAKISYSAVLFYGYVFVLGMAFYFTLRWFRWGRPGQGAVRRGR
jgi:hypothetical protein